MLCLLISFPSKPGPLNGIELTTGKSLCPESPKRFRYGGDRKRGIVAMASELRAPARQLHASQETDRTATQITAAFEH